MERPRCAVAASGVMVAGVEGVQSLLDALSENLSLQEVRVEGNQACWDQVDEIEAATRRNRDRANTGELCTNAG